MGGVPGSQPDSSGGRRRRACALRLAAAVVCVALTSVFAQPAVLAQSQQQGWCDARVHDEARLLRNFLPADVIAGDMESAGALVRVRTVPASRGPAARYLETLLAQCTSWQSAGGVQPNLIVMVFS